MRSCRKINWDACRSFGQPLVAAVGSLNLGPGFWLSKTLGSEQDTSWSGCCQLRKNRRLRMFRPHVAPKSGNWICLVLRSGWCDRLHIRHLASLEGRVGVKKRKRSPKWIIRSNGTMRIPTWTGLATGLSTQFTTPQLALLLYSYMSWRRNTLWPAILRKTRTRTSMLSSLTIHNKTSCVALFQLCPTRPNALTRYSTSYEVSFPRIFIFNPSISARSYTLPSPFLIH